MLPARPADGLPRLPLRLRGDRAGVHDHGMAQPRPRGLAADHFRLEGVEPASERDERGFSHGRLRHAAAPENSSSGSSPSNSYSTGPAMSM